MPGLRLRDVDAGDLTAAFSDWVDRLESLPAKRTAVESLYAGDHWKVVRTLQRSATASGLRATIWVCSAGYGLLPLDVEIKPYSATFSNRDSDSVCRWSDQEDESLARRTQSWWLRMTNWRGPTGAKARSIAAIAERQPTVPLIVVVSATYLSAITADLLKARELLADPDLLTIVSAGTHSLPTLEPHLLPITADWQRTLGGNLTSLNARIAKSILAQCGPYGLRTSTIRARLTAPESLPPRKRRVARSRITDEQILEFIRMGIRQQPGSSQSLLLRRLRDGGKACEQGRFAALFRSISDSHAYSGAESA